MAKGNIDIKISQDDPEVAYVYLSRHPRCVDKQVVYKQLALNNLIANYQGPSIYLDFDEEGYLIGIEILE